MYDLVMANPPYQGTSKMSDANYVSSQYPLGKADLYAAFLLRGLQLTRIGGVSAMLTMRNWMFIKQYVALRERLLEKSDLRALGDFAIGAFDEVPNDLLSVVVSVFRKTPPSDVRSVAQQPTPPDDRSYDRARTRRKRAATLCHVGRHEFSPAALKVVIEDRPLVYYWSQTQLGAYARADLVGDVCPARFGLTTGDNARFVVRAWEVAEVSTSSGDHPWAAFVLGAKGIRWMEPVQNAIRWRGNGIEVKVKCESQYGTVSKQIRNEDFYFRAGVAFTAIGVDFGARAFRVPAVFSNTGLSLFPDDTARAVCSLNRSESQRIVNDIAPGLKYEVGDVNRIPLFPDIEAPRILQGVDRAFTIYESHREPSVEFLEPGPFPWRHAQEWAQIAVDRPEGEPLPPYIEELDSEPTTDHLSFALGVALGRFGGEGEGILHPTKDNLSAALPSGICFLDGSLEKSVGGDSLGRSPTGLLHAKWAEYGAGVDSDSDLRTWLRLKFFGEIHKGMYENRPIYFPLSSEKKTFVAYVSIHRWTEDTLRALLAEHLHPALTRLEGEIADLRESARVRTRRSPARPSAVTTRSPSGSRSSTTSSPRSSSALRRARCPPTPRPPSARSMPATRPISTTA